MIIYRRYEVLCPFCGASANLLDLMKGQGPHGSCGLNSCPSCARLGLAEHWAKMATD